MIEQTPFGTISFADNPEPRLPCVLILDISGSMKGAPIQELNAGLLAYKSALLADNLAARRVEVALVTFGEQVQTACDFAAVEGFHPPSLTAAGLTPMGEAIRQGLDLLRHRKELYKAHGVAYFRPWVFLITDGGPTDEWQSAAAKIKAGELEILFMFFSVGVRGANFEILKQLSDRAPPLKLAGLRFQDLFLWLSNSLAAVSRSSPGDAVPLSDPTGPRGWCSTV
jgi:uncharacterized protein YegL